MQPTARSLPSGTPSAPGTRWRRTARRLPPAPHERSSSRVITSAWVRSSPEMSASSRARRPRRCCDGGRSARDESRSCGRPGGRIPRRAATSRHGSTRLLKQQTGHLGMPPWPINPPATWTTTRELSRSGLWANPIREACSGSCGSTLLRPVIEREQRLRAGHRHEGRRADRGSRRRRCPAKRGRGRGRAGPYRRLLFRAVHAIVASANERKKGMELGQSAD